MLLLATSSEEELRRQIEFLKAENEMLRKRVPKKRIFLENEERERLLIRDNDACYLGESDEVFEQTDAAVEPTALRAPNQNAYIERWIGSLKSECLDRFWVFGLAHLDYICFEFVSYYNQRRPHQRIGNKPPLGTWSDNDELLREGERIVCHSKLGGVLKHYERVAA